MASAIKHGRPTTKTQGRAIMRNLDQMFPNSNRSHAVSNAPNYEAEIASIRRAVQDPTVKTFDTSGLTWMLHHNREKLAKELASAVDGRYHWRVNPTHRSELAALMQASEGDREKSKELASYRTFEITTDLMPGPFAGAGFQSINLSADEMPQIITPQSRQYFNVYWMGQDGGTKRAQWRTMREAESLEIALLNSDKVEYPLVDLQRGDVNQFDKVNTQLRWDMDWKIEKLALESMLANRQLSGMRAKLNVHPDIIQDNIPDSNYLDLTNVATYGADGVWTLARLKALLRYFAMWGYTAGADPDGPIQLKSMIMSPLNAQDAWDYVDLVSGFDSSGTFGKSNPVDTVSTAQRDAIMSNGGLMQSAWGHSWTTQFNARIIKGRLYAMTNQPIGWQFTKTDWDKTFEWKDDVDHVIQNMGEIMMRKAISFVQPELWGYRYLIVDFSAAAAATW